TESGRYDQLAQQGAAARRRPARRPIVPQGQRDAVEDRALHRGHTAHRAPRRPASRNGRGRAHLRTDHDDDALGPGATALTLRQKRKRRRLSAPPPTPQKRGNYFSDDETFSNVELSLRSEERRVGKERSE